MFYFPESNTNYFYQMLLFSLRYEQSIWCFQAVFSVGFYKPCHSLGMKSRAIRAELSLRFPRPEQAGKALLPARGARCGARPARRVALALHAPPARPRAALRDAAKGASCPRSQAAPSVTFLSKYWHRFCKWLLNGFGAIDTMLFARGWVNKPQPALCVSLTWRRAGGTPTARGCEPADFWLG